MNRRGLFAKVRKLERTISAWHSAWTIDGKKFVRKSQCDQVKRIYEVEDLKNIVKSLPTLQCSQFFFCFPPPKINLCDVFLFGGEFVGGRFGFIFLISYYSCYSDNSANGFCSLERKDFVKFLGILIDCNLKWKHHIDFISLKISKTIGILARLRHFVPTETLASNDLSLT